MTPTRIILTGAVLIIVWFLASRGLGQLGSDGPADAAAAEKAVVKKSDEATPVEKKALSVFMRKKLGASNSILEGLVTDDLKMVARGADALLEMSDAEKWRASNDMMYLNHSREFRSSVEAMLKKADKGSIDGAALAWVDVTMNCIKCHEWVRDTMLADSPVH